LLVILQRRHLRPCFKVSFFAKKVVNQRTYFNLLVCFERYSTRTTSPSTLNVGSIEGPTQTVISRTYSWTQWRMQPKWVIIPTCVTSSEIIGFLLQNDDIVGGMNNQRSQVTTWIPLWSNVFLLYFQQCFRWILWWMRGVMNKKYIKWTIEQLRCRVQNEQ
jgi:hypothetical protein